MYSYNINNLKYPHLLYEYLTKQLNQSDFHLECEHTDTTTIVNNPPTWSERNRAYYINHIIFGGDTIRLNIKNTLASLADVTAQARLTFWYIDNERLALFRDDPHIDRLYVLYENYKNKS